MGTGLYTLRLRHVKQRASTSSCILGHSLIRTWQADKNLLQPLGPALSAWAQDLCPAGKRSQLLMDLLSRGGSHAFFWK
ncbi:hypothetical protein PAXRUDRAFT_830403 [Paxillus rubicundulus Ve08.2h10]|uniref:Uncharacterized protein n=1 Tax=Paxillus rubicundulus Ve08.2h10 TaxID=930991 RepID=A0A0D0E468_9AGAM|nr:hypothetical protein PAXRUDRAFT_830403 [Paxillus rubicundulus Ve08.2h10]